MQVNKECALIFVCGAPAAPGCSGGSCGYTTSAHRTPFIESLRINDWNKGRKFTVPSQQIVRSNCLLEYRPQPVQSDLLGIHILKRYVSFMALPVHPVGGLNTLGPVPRGEEQPNEDVAYLPHDSLCTHPFTVRDYTQQLSRTGEPSTSVNPQSGAA
jgi:hypothetical protein